jgi:hypothetical protein
MRGRLTAEVRDKPKQKREYETEEEASDDWEIERSVFAAVDDVAREPPEPHGEFGAEVKKGADDDEECAENEERAADIAEGVHGKSLEEMK